MNNKLFTVLAVVMPLALACPSGFAAGPKGAKAIFDSGEGPTSGASLARTPDASFLEPVRQEKYIGISYQLVLLGDDAQFRVVPKSRTFKTGERMKMLVRTNRPGYMTILNIGSSGSTNVLFNEYVEGLKMVEVPGSGNFRFVGDPGTETVLVMLSNEPNPIGGQTTTMAGTVPPPPPPPSTTLPPPVAGYGSTPPSLPTSDTPPPGGYGSTTGGYGSTPSPLPTSDTPPPPPGGSPYTGGTPPLRPSDILAGIVGAKGAKGAKDIVVEDGMKSSYSVVSRKNNWKPVSGGMKDIVLESAGGSNYGVIPASTMAGGGILTIEIKLRHR